MWLWEEDSERGGYEGPRADPDLISDVRALRSWFREGRERRPIVVCGYGHGWTRFSNKAYPLVVLIDQYPHWEYWMRHLFRGVEPRLVERTLSERGRQELDLPKTKLPLFALLMAEPQASSWGSDLLDQLRPIRNGLLCAETESIGSAGVAVRLADGATGILSAGHVFPLGKGSEVHVVNGLSFWKRAKPLGKIEHHSVPIGTSAGWDVAIVRAESQMRTLAAVSTRWPSVRHGHELVHAKGARSGFVDNAVLIAGLEEVTAAQMSWSCCWLIGPPTALTKGDSGASVFARKTGELLGTYVGASRLGDDTPYAAFVQDAYSLQQNVLCNWSVSF